MRFPLYLPVLAALAQAATAGPRLNEIQAIGTHNSYHVAPPPGVLAVLDTFRKGASAQIGRTMPPLATQLDAGIRQLELDVHADPAGGLYAAPLAMNLAALAGKKVPPYDPDGVMRQPGFKLIHIPDIDCWSNSRTLAAALGEMSAWSAAHPAHLPVFVLIECKDEAHPPLPTRPIPFDRAQLMALEREILAVIPTARIFRPDDLRGPEKSLPAAIAKHGWPEVDALRGKFLFALDNGGEIASQYLQDNPALEGRLLFVSADGPESPAAAWFKCNNPVRDFQRIQDLVKRGFLVRTRADDGPANAEMRDKALASGAQWISTDHADDSPESATRVAFPVGKTVRPNPISGKSDQPITP